MVGRKIITDLPRGGGGSFPTEGSGGRKGVGKSETLTIRLDPKTRFMLEFMARHRGQTITTVVERAITAAANGLVIEDDESQRSWEYYWSIEEGVRALKVAAERQLYPSYDEERRIAFAREHWPFFYLSARKENLRAAFVSILWPRIDEFLDIWENDRRRDYFAAGKAMQQALKDAGVQPPTWPIPADPPPKTGPRESFAADLDDEIPF